MDSYGVGSISLVEGANYDLLLANTGEDGPYWTLQRIAKDGTLIDSLPHGYLTYSESDEIYRSYDLVTLTWCDPYYYIIKRYSDSLYYVRIDENLVVYDSIPVPFCETANKVETDGKYIWLVRIGNIGNLLITLYQLPSTNPVFKDLSVDRLPSYLDSYYGVFAHNGLLIHDRYNPDSVFNTEFVSIGGEAYPMVSVSYANIDSRVLRDGSFIPFGEDSIIYSCFNRSQDSNYAVNYFFASKFITDSSEIRTLNLDSLCCGIYTSFWGSFCQDRKLGFIGNYWTKPDNSVFYLQIDPLTNEKLNELFLPMVPAPYETEYWQVKADSDNIRFYYAYEHNAYLSMIPLNDPTGISPRKQLVYNTKHMRCPTMTNDGSDIILYCQEHDTSEITIGGFRSTNDATGDWNFEEMYFTFPNKNPRMPHLYNINGDLMVHWMDEAVQQYDRMWYANKIAFVDNGIPDFETAIELDTNKASFSYHASRSDLYRPQILISDSTLIANCFLDFDCNSICNFKMGKYDLSDNPSLAWSYFYGSGGVPAIFLNQDSINMIYPYAYCTEWYGYCQCDNYAGAYRGNKIIDSALFSFTPDSNYYNWGYCRPDLGISVIDNSIYVAENFNRTIARFNSNTGNLTGVVNLGPYIYESFHDGCYAGHSSIINTNNFYIVFYMSNDPRYSSIMAFDKDWNYIESVRVPLVGVNQLLSEFIYDEINNRLNFAYSAWLPYPYGGFKIVVQSIKFQDYVDVESTDDFVLPNTAKLLQNYPNPFNPETTIEYSIPSRSHVSITIYNILGKKVKTILDEEKPAGEHSVKWDGVDDSNQPVASGIYFYRLKSGEKNLTSKMVLLK